MKRFTLLVLAAVCLAGSPIAPRSADACAMAFRPNAVVRMTGEEALIVYDKQSRKQHFIRTASFANAPEDFGFMVPTPTQPELGEVDSRVFRRLFQIYKAPERRRRSRSSGGTTMSARGGGGGMPQAVQVVSQQEVAGMDAAVLLASDPNALAEWLRGKNFPMPEGGAEWLAPYVARGWYVTAFRISPHASGRGFRTRAIKMSFETDRPFFPYSEPQKSERTRRRPFRVTVISDERVRGVLGTRLEGQPPLAWRTRAGFARQVNRLRLSRALGNSITDAELPQDAWMTTFDERRSRRGRHDLFFVRARSQRAVRSRIRRQLTPNGTRRSRRSPLERRARQNNVIDPWR